MLTGWPQCRDPYMLIAERAGGRPVRLLTAFCITVTLYGVGCVVIVLLGNFLHNIGSSLGLSLSHCSWMAVATAFLLPLCWLGTPKDFW